MWLQINVRKKLNHRKLRIRERNQTKIKNQAAAIEKESKRVLTSISAVPHRQAAAASLWVMKPGGGASSLCIHCLP